MQPKTPPCPERSYRSTRFEAGPGSQYHCKHGYLHSLEGESRWSHRYGYPVSRNPCHIRFDESGISESLNDYLWGRCAVKDIAYDVTDNVGIKNGELYFIPSSMKLGEIARILREGYDAELLNDGLKKVMSIFGMDYLFIDTHPGLNEETLISAAISDLFIVVLRPDNQDYQGTSISLEVARRIGITCTSLLINKIPVT